MAGDPKVTIRKALNGDKVGTRKAKRKSLSFFV